jgi:putative tricarboxylic transport membrane protein
MRVDSCSSLVWFILGVAVVYTSYKMGMGVLAKPGPGLFTFICGVILCAMAVVVFVHSQIEKQEEKAKRVIRLWTSLKWHKTLLSILLLVVYALILTRIGFLASTIFLLIFLFRIIGPVKWWVAVCGAVAASVVSFVVFSMVMKVQLPVTFLEMLLFKMKQILF